MDFVATLVVILTYLVRPQDWVAGLGGKEIMTPLMAWALLAMIIRNRGFSPRSLIQTPVDIAVHAYLFYIAAASEDFIGTARGIFPYWGYYVVVAQALSSAEKTKKYLTFWMAGIAIVAAMAVASEYGIDPTKSHAITHAFPDQPRLVLNTYLFKNPNALGHTVVLLLPLTYFLLWWRGSIMKKVLAVAILAVALYCLSLTVSKGAFLVAFGMVFFSLMLGQKKIVQLGLIIVALTSGTVALQQLPRMEQIGAGKSGRDDEAILGRLLAWEQARAAYNTYPTGQGLRQFQAVIRFEGEYIPKATHSSFVLIGAELGRVGMFFFLGVLYCSLRFLIFVRCPYQDDEQSRRAIAMIILGYCMSGWMIDRAYHLEYFFMAGVASALQRRMGVMAGAYEPVDPDPDAYENQYLFGGSENVAEDRDKITGKLEEVDSEAMEELYEEEPQDVPTSLWSRIGPLDLLLIGGGIIAVDRIWQYIILNF